MHRPVEAGLLAAGQIADGGPGAVDARVVADDDPRAGLGEKPRTGRADAAAGAGDARDLAAESLADPSSQPASPRDLARRCYAKGRGIVTALASIAVRAM